MELITWLEPMQKWYNESISLRFQIISLIHSPPDMLWQPHHSHVQLKAIEIWLDGCMKISKYSKSFHTRNSPINI